MRRTSKVGDDALESHRIGILLKSEGQGIVHLVEFALICEDEVTFVATCWVCCGYRYIMACPSQPLGLQDFKVGVREQIHAHAVGGLLQGGQQHLHENGIWFEVSSL